MTQNKEIIRWLKMFVEPEKPNLQDEYLREISRGSIPLCLYWKEVVKIYERQTASHKKPMKKATKMDDSMDYMKKKKQTKE